MWLLFAILTTILWGLAELFYKKGAKPDEKYSHLKITICDDSKTIFNYLGELSTWPTEKFTLVYRLIEKITIGIEFELKDKCETCGGEITVPITFPDGYKSLFVPTVSDFGDELL